MRTNAIVRIVIWSLVILILSGILLAGLGVGRFANTPISVSPVETMVPQRTEATQATSVTQVQPDAGLRFSADEITELNIEWVTGTITIEPADIDVIQISETNSNPKHPMRWKQKGSKLSIDFCEESLSRGFGISVDISKDLTILVPQGWVCNELEIDAAAATLEVRDLSFRDVEIDAASGTCAFINCNVDSMDIDTASGDVKFSGSLNALECDAASASFKGVLSNVPWRINMDSMSGDLDLTLPADAGFTVILEAMSSDFFSDFDTTSRNGAYVHGDGYCRIEMDAMSGDVVIRKGDAATAAACPIPGHVHSSDCFSENSSCPDPHHEHTSHCQNGQHH